MKTLCVFLVALFVANVQAATVDFSVTTPQPVASTTASGPTPTGGTYTHTFWPVTVAVKITGNTSSGTVTYWLTSPKVQWLGWGGGIDANGAPSVQHFNLPGAGTFTVIAQYTEVGSRVAGSPPPAVSKSAPLTIVAK